MPSYEQKPDNRVIIERGGYRPTGNPPATPPNKAPSPAAQAPPPPSHGQTAPSQGSN